MAIDKKTKYFEKVGKNFDLYKKLVSENNDKKNKEILLMPKTEEEFDLADSILTFFIDVRDLVEYINEHYEKQDFENNYAFNMYYNIINSLKHNNQREIEKIKIYLKNKIDPKQGAKLIFDLLHIMSNSGADFFDKLRIKCGYDDSVESLIEFRDYLNSANKITSEAKGIINLSSIDFENDVQKNTTINCIKEFHLLVDEKLNKGKKLKMK